VKTLLEHDNIITSIDVNKGDKETLVSASWDLSIKVWPQSSANSSRTFSGHLDVIWNVKWNPKSFDILCSCSQDATAKLWDQRQLEASTTISVPVSAYSLAWTSENNIVVGTQQGSLIYVDTRKPNEIVAQKVLHKSSIKSLSVHPHKENILACGSDDSSVSIVSLPDFKVEKKIETHKDFVRALAWNKNILASGSWDKSIQLCTF